MKIKFGSIVTDGRGKLGGQVYSRNRSGAYVRNKVTPLNPQTVYQSAARSRLAGFSEAWRGLTQEQRDAWDAAAPNFPTTNQFGDEVIPTGKNLFTRLNVNLADIGQGMIETPPTPQTIIEPENLAIVVNSAPTLTIDFAGGEGMTYKIFATPSLSPGTSFFKNKFKFIKSIQAPDGTPNDLLSEWQERFGEFNVGDKIAVKAVPVVNATGQKGIGVTASAIVVTG